MSAAPSSLFDNILFNQSTFGGNLAGLIPVSVSRLIYAALRKAAVTLGPQRIPSPAQMQDGIEEINRLISSLNCDRLFIYSLDIQEFPLQAGKKKYTIGQDPASAVLADFDVPRPQAISFANVIAANGAQPLRYPLALYTQQVWAGIVMQDLPDTIPQGIYNDRASPLSTIYVYGQPMASMSLELYTWHLVPQFQSESDGVFLPPGYDDALVLNLACRLAPHFQRVLDADVRAQARESLMRVLSLNAPQPIATVRGLDGCGCDHYDIYGDEFR
jgi:hypothetical protein